MKYNCNHIIKENFLESLLRLRGIDNYLEYLNPKPEDLCNPYDLDNISEAADLLLEKLEDKTSEIHFIVDCDQDGYTSSAMLWNYIKEQYPEAKLSYHIHSGKQHGLEDMIDGIENSGAKIDLMIVPDAGSNDYEYHKRLANMGIPTIVLDHHEVDKYSEDAIVVNNQLSEKYPNKGLSGAGVVYKFLEVLDDKLGIQKADNYMDLAAVGIVGDMMTMTTIENRYIVSKGLSNIKNNCIEEIINKQSFSIKDKNHITPITVSFYIVPLINAVIRVGRESEKETLFLSLIDGKRMVPKISRNKVVEGQFESLGEQNARNCVNARGRQNRAKDKAIEQLEMKIIKNGLDENKIIFVEVDNEDIDSTLTGLVAMQLMAKYKKPVIVARENDEGFLRGSARGDTKSALKDLRQFFIDSGYFEYAEGHAAAHGISIERKKLEPFISYANKELADVNFNEGVYEADFVFKADQGDEISEAILDLTQFPDIWGKDNEEPLIVIENIRLKRNDIIVYDTKSPATVKFTYAGIDYLKFSADSFKEELDNMKEIELTIIGRANLNEWQGTTKPQIFIEDYNLRNPVFDF